MNKTQFTSFASANNVRTAYSGNERKMFVKGETSAVNKFVLKCNLQGKAKIPFNLVKA